MASNTQSSRGQPTGESGDRLKKAICSFYMRGACKFGKDCRFLHPADYSPTIPSASVSEGSNQHSSNMAPNSSNYRVSEVDSTIDSQIFLPQSAKPCIFFAQGNCHNGNLCRFSHIAVPSNSTLMDCPICIQEIVPPKMFGLLSECEHAVCLDCIRSWRKSGDMNEGRFGCPICRKESRLIIPSAIFASGSEKNEIRANYLTKLSTIPCKLFDYGKGTCKFAPECHYAHMKLDGELAVDGYGFQHSGQPRPRRARPNRRLNTTSQESPLTPWEVNQFLRVIGTQERSATDIELALAMFRMGIRLGMSPEEAGALLAPGIGEDSGPDDVDSDNSEDFDYFASSSDDSIDLGSLYLR